MPDPLIVRTTADEFFSEALVTALHQERVEVSALTLSYVVDLLMAQMTTTCHPSVSLSDWYLTALRKRRYEQVHILRQVGDAALMTFPWSRSNLRLRRISNARLYMQIGARAYRTIGGRPYAEMAKHFCGLVDALMHLGDEQSMATPKGNLQLYELWEQTHSWYIGRLLNAQGIMVAMPSSERS
jgi:hypothetical protein